MPVDRHVRIIHAGKHRRTHQYAHTVSTRHIRTHMHTGALTYAYVHTTPMYIHTDPHRTHIYTHSDQSKSYRKDYPLCTRAHTCRHRAVRPHTWPWTARGRWPDDCPPLPELPSVGSYRKQFFPSPSLIRISPCGLLHAPLGYFPRVGVCLNSLLRRHGAGGPLARHLREKGTLGPDGVQGQSFIPSLWGVTNNHASALPGLEDPAPLSPE